MARKLTISLSLAALILLALTTGSGGQTVGDKPKMLAQLANSAKASLPAVASTLASRFPTETQQLALDLIVYRWAAGSPNEPANADAIVSALVKPLNDTTINWAFKAFSTGSEAGEATVLPPQDERAPLLLELRMDHTAATDRAKSSPSASVAALITVLDTCQKLQLDICEAFVRKELGDHYFHDMHRYRQAGTCYIRSAGIFSAYQFLESSAAVHESYGSLGMQIGSVTEAVENYKRAAQYWLRLAKDNPKAPRYCWHAGRAYMSAGSILEASYGATQGSTPLDLMKRGLEQYRVYAGASRDYHDLAVNLMKVADVYKSRGETQRALGILEEAKQRSKQQGDLILTAEVYLRLAGVYSAQRNEGLATEANRKRGITLAEAAARGTTDLARLGRAGNIAAPAREKLLRSAEQGAAAADELAQYVRSAEMYEKLADTYRQLGLADRQIPALRALADVQDKLGKPDKSLQARLEAVTIARKANDNALAAEIALEVVDAFLAIGDLENAKEGFMDLAAIFVAAGDVRGAGRVLEARGELLANDGQHLAAVQDFENAREKYISDVDDPWAHGDVCVKLAGAYRSAGKPEDARRILQTAIDEIETRYSSENLDPNTDAERSRTTMSLYRELATECVRAGDEEEAAILLARAKRYSWLPELVRTLRASEDAAVAEFAARLDILGAPDMASGNPTLPVAARPIADTWPRWVEECWILESGSRHRSSYNALPINPLDLFGQRLALPKQGLVVEYMPTVNSMYVFICGFGRSIIRQVDVRSKDVDKLVVDLRKQWKDLEDSMAAGVPIPKIVDWTEPSFVQVRRPLSELHKLLIEPIKDDLNGRKLLVFALPDELAGLPMHALISSEPTEKPRFLVHDYEIGYLSRGMLDNLTSKESRVIDSSSDRLVIFADPQADLPGARDEARAIEKMYFESQSYVGQRANVSNLRAEARKAHILHIAAHYWIHPNPSGFALQLAPEGESDGRIGVEELYEMMGPHIGLVVLSTCSSISSSDPISTGQARAAEIFLLAGVRSVMGGLWKVSDAAAAKIVVDFYRGLSRGQSRTEALRRAQLAVIDFKESGEFAHPFFWACFAVYGNPW